MLSTQVVSNPIKPNALFLEQIFCMPLYYSEMEFKDYLYEHNFYNFSISPNCKVGENKSEHLYHKTYIFGQDHTRKQKHPHTRFQRACSEGRAIPPPVRHKPSPISHKAQQPLSLMGNVAQKQHHNAEQKEGSEVRLTVVKTRLRHPITAIPSPSLVFHLPKESASIFFKGFL